MALESGQEGPLKLMSLGQQSKAVSWLESLSLTKLTVHTQFLLS